jgi:hypothetical protein
MKSLFSVARHSARGGLLATCLLVSAATWAQASAPARVCTQAPAMTPHHLYGTWQLALWLPAGSESVPTSTGTVRFERHPEYTGSVRGHIQRTAAGAPGQALVSGDVIDGEFNLDESADGVTIDAVWVGVPQDCGQTIRGTRRTAEGQVRASELLQFLLRKSPGWQ